MYHKQNQNSKTHKLLFLQNKKSARCICLHESKVKQIVGGTLGDAPGSYEGSFSFTIGENVALGYSTTVRISKTGFGHGSVNASLGAARSVIVAVRGPDGQPMAHSLCTPQPAP